MENETKFIKLCFKEGNLPGLEEIEVINYIKYIMNRRCEQLEVPIQFPEIKENPLPWVDEALGMTITNFFNGTPSDYTKSSNIENWEDVY
jgi:ribonucleoside-diphosphate reductase beta chain